MLKIRNLAAPYTRELGDGTLRQITKQVYFVDDWRTYTIDVPDSFDLYQASVELLSDDAKKLRIQSAPDEIKYKDATFRTDSATLAALREIGELMEPGEVAKFKAVSGTVDVSADDALAIRKLVNTGVQSAFRKFSACDEAIKGLKTIEDVEAFSLAKLWSES